MTTRSAPSRSVPPSSARAARLAAACLALAAVALGATRADEPAAAAGGRETGETAAPATGGTPVPPTDGAPGRPNIVWIIADDVSAVDLGCYGHPTIRTPHLDELARGGLLFQQAFLPCSSCSPSRCSLITGRYPHATGAPELHQPLPAEQVTIAETLRAAGYYTVAAGKWHLGEPTKAEFDRVVEGGGPSGCENWVPVLAERPTDRPFFAWLAALDAHRPYPVEAIPAPYHNADALVPPYLVDTPATRRDLALYYDEISRLDGFIGRVVEELRRQGVLENTLIAFLADNGRPFPRCKTTVYDSGVQTPLILAWPKGLAPGRRGQLVSSIDLMPTCLELAGAAVPATVQGVSLRPAFADPFTPVRDAVYAEQNWHDYRAWKRSVRTADYLYIRNATPGLTLSPPADAVTGDSFQELVRLRETGRLSGPQGVYFATPRPTEELYDVKTDPHQLHDLATDPDMAATLADLRARQAAWGVQTGDTPADAVDVDALTPDRFDRLTGKRLPDAARPPRRAR